MTKRHGKKLTRGFLRSLRPERKVPLTKEGERIIGNPASLEKAYQQIRSRDELKKSPREAEAAS